MRMLMLCLGILLLSACRSLPHAEKNGLYLDVIITLEDAFQDPISIRPGQETMLGFTVQYLADDGFDIHLVNPLVLWESGAQAVISHVQHQVLDDTSIYYSAHYQARQDRHQDLVLARLTEIPEREVAFVVHVDAQGTPVQPQMIVSGEGDQ